MYTLSLVLFDASEAIHTRRELHTFQHPALLSLDTPTGLPPALDRAVTSSPAALAPPSAFPFALFAPFAVLGAPPSSPPQLPQLSRKQHRLVTPTSIKAPFEPLRPLDWRFGPVSIDSLDRITPSTMPGPRHRRHPAHSSEQQPQHIDVGYGTIHLYRDRASSSSSSSSSSTESSDILAILAIPAAMSLSDFLNFLMPSRKYESISHVRMLRDAMPNRCMALLKFANTPDADDFRKENNGKPFWSMFDDEICHVVPVESIQITHSAVPPFTFPFPSYPRDNNSPDDSSRTKEEKEKSLAEIPTCPVCLERMDISVTGLITIMCQHTFHCHCLSKWENSKCPVCRYSQVRRRAPASAITSADSSSTHNNVDFSNTERKCDVCGEESSNWMCLICGHVGCGRYQGQHAFRHFEQTVHLYAIELGSQRIWDYGGDSYVHRLIQDKTDGRLVELPSLYPSYGNNTQSDEQQQQQHGGPPNTYATLNQAKIEAVSSEYSHLLTSQLDSQRAFYEDRIVGLKCKVDEAAAIEATLKSETTALLEQNSTLRLELEQIKLENNTAIQSLTKQKDKIQAKATKAEDLARNLAKDLAEEKQVSKGLWENVTALKTDVGKQRSESELLKTQVQDLNEQVRDLMFTLTAQSRIADASKIQPQTSESASNALSELAGGDLVIPQQPPPSNSRRKKK